MDNNSPLQFSKMFSISNTYIILQRYYYPNITGEKFEAQKGSGQLEVSTHRWRVVSYIAAAG